jgi:AcrR family transcriptional regulator
MPRRRDPARYEARRNTILDAATSVFRAKGYENARLEDVAEAVSITKASVYYYFPKKSDLLVEICNRAIDRSVARQKRILSSELPVDERLKEAVRDHVHGMAANISIWSIFFRELEIELHDDPRRKNINAQLKQFGQRFQSLLDEGIEEGVFRPLDTRLVSNAILGMLNWSHRWIQPEDPAKVADTLVEFMERGLLRA